ncbi:MAG: DUF2088 domain-containing protein [Myxococcales bacterium]|nr:DUF2088 domain-containing protein [Myxococcales bacterium]
MQVSIGWGRAPQALTVPDGATVFTAPPPPPAAADWSARVAAALAAPVGSAPLAARLAGIRRVAVLVPDRTRKGVTEALWGPVRAALEAAGVAWTVGVATGKHPPTPQGPPGAWVHDAHDPALVRVGHTAAGTPVAFPAAVLEADLRVVLGEIRPHYFAGWAGGAKGLFPGVAGEAGIWRNHLLKAAPGARLGQVEGNPCRADMEAAAALAGPSFIVNLVRGAAGPVHVVAGDPVAAHRAGVALARPLFEVHSPRRFPVVVVSDGHPVTASLYQACKLLPPAGALVAPGGRVVLAAALHEGVGPVQVINEAIFDLGVRHALPPGVEVWLASTRSAAEIAPTFARWTPSVEAALAGVVGPELAVCPHAGELVPVGTPAPMTGAE